MPWKETSPMNERVKFVAAMLAADETFLELCERFGISRKQRAAGTIRRAKSRVVRGLRARGEDFARGTGAAGGRRDPRDFRCSRRATPCEDCAVASRRFQARTPNLGLALLASWRFTLLDSARRLRGRAASCGTSIHARRPSDATTVSAIGAAAWQPHG
jgi:hypothetical protein